MMVIGDFNGRLNQLLFSGPDSCFSLKRPFSFVQKELHMVLRGVNPWQKWPTIDNTHNKA